MRSGSCSTVGSYLDCAFVGVKDDLRRHSSHVGETASQQVAVDRFASRGRSDSHIRANAGSDSSRSTVTARPANGPRRQPAMRGGGPTPLLRVFWKCPTGRLATDRCGCSQGPTDLSSHGRHHGDQPSGDAGDGRACAGTALVESGGLVMNTMDPQDRRQAAEDALEALVQTVRGISGWRAVSAQSPSCRGYETLGLYAIEGPHAHGSRDRVDTAHHGGDRGTEHIGHAGRGRDER